MASTATSFGIKPCRAEESLPSPTSAAGRDAGAVGLLTSEHGPVGDDVADRTYHLVDGLALHATLWPLRYPPEHIRAVLAAHLDSLISGRPNQ